MKNSLLNIVNVSLHLPGIDKPILTDLNYQVQSGDFIIVLGSNGSGKSSFLKLLDQRYQATEGNIYLHQQPIQEISQQIFNKKVITLTQNCHESLFPSLTIFENYLLTKHRYSKKLFCLRRKKERHFLEEYLLQFNPNLALKLDQIVDKLSGGEKQAFALALSVLHPPEILLLDEHTSALDPKAAKTLMALTQQIIAIHGITCILTTHQLDIAMNYGNRILALQEGKIYQTFDERDKRNMSQQDLLTVCY